VIVKLILCFCCFFQIDAIYDIWPLKRNDWPKAIKCVLTEPLMCAYNIDSR